LWANALARWVYISFATPGIVVHELSHWAMCKLTGARVAKVVLVSREGGSVSHGPSKLGMVGQVLIFMAPFLGIPLVLVLSGIAFDRFLGCEIYWDMDIDGSVGSILVGAFTSTFDLIGRNLVHKGAWWFLLYIYLASSLTVALAPSKQDLKNAAIGLAGILAAVLAWVLVMERLVPGWSFPVLSPVVELLGWVVVVGLMAGMLGAVLALPFLIIGRSSR